MVKRHLENEPAEEARITAFMAEWGTGRGGKQRHVALKVLTAELGFNARRRRRRRRASRKRRRWRWWSQKQRRQSGQY